MTSGPDRASAESLLSAGAILPVDTADVGDQGVPFTARTYRHPVLGDRPVVRLVDAALGEGEDIATGFLGLTSAAQPAVVGLGPRRPLAFPEWVLVHHPDDGRHALAVVPELQKLAKLVRSRPKAALDGHQAIADRFARALPHLLPTFFEQAARVFLAAGQQTYATQLFNKARKAEAEHGLPVDLDRLDEVYLEFVSAKVVSAVALAGYAKELSAQLPAEEALERVCRLALRAAATGVAPSGQSATAVQRLVRSATRAAGKRAAAVAEQEAAYLTELLRLPVTADAPAGWWKVHLPAVTALAGRDPAIRGSLLDLMPADRDHLPGWLTVLTETGALAGLAELDAPEAARPQDGTVGWLRRLLTRLGSSSRRLPQLYPLVERIADRLRVELAASGETLTVLGDVDLLDLLLSLGLPMTPPQEEHILDLTRWVRSGGERDLHALAGDDRFTNALRRGLQQYDHRPDGLRRITETPGLVPMLTDWLRSRIRDRFGAGLPHLREAVDWLNRVAPEARCLALDGFAPGVELAPGVDLGRLLDVDLPEQVTRSLRGGLFAELGWPAWEQAWQEVTGGDPKVEILQQEAWPYLILAGPTTVRVLDADGIVLRHDLRIPAGDLRGRPGYHYVDGHLLVFWRSWTSGVELRGYWHSSPGEPQPLEGQSDRQQQLRGDVVTLPLPGAGRTTGGGVLHVGDTVVPPELRVVTDGTRHWVYRVGQTRSDHGWHEYDPAGNTYGQRGLPRFLTDLPSDAVGLDEWNSWLRPALADRRTPAAVPVDGLLGWRVLTLADGSACGEDLAGRRVTVPAGKRPVAVLALPGDDRLRAILTGGVLLDPDGVPSAVVGRSSGQAAAHPIPLPEQAFLGNLRPRDPAGSAALRRFDRDTAAALLKAALDERHAEIEALRAAAQPGTANPAPVGTLGATVGGTATGAGTATSGATGDPAGPDTLVELVRSTLPTIGDETLLTGVADVLRLAARVQTDLAAATERISELLSAAAKAAPVETVSGPTDDELLVALDGLTMSSYRTSTATASFTQLRALATQQSATTAGSPGALLHLDGPQLPSGLPWWSLLAAVPAIAYRVAAGVVADEHREVLGAFLGELDQLGLSTAADATRWRRHTLHVRSEHLRNPADDRPRRAEAGILPLPGGAFIAVLAHIWSDNGQRLEALHHDPAGVFEVPAPYTTVSSAPIGDDQRPAGWLGRLRAELAARGPLPWRPEAAERFAELTGVTGTAAKLVLAGLPGVDSAKTLPAEVRKALGIKQVSELKLAYDLLRVARRKVLWPLLSALLPDDPARLWTDGPDVAAAAAVWNAAMGRRVAVPEALLAEAVREVRIGWGPTRALPALLDPAGSPELSTDLAYQISGDRARQVDARATGFTGEVLRSTIALAAWVAHHTPAGDPCRSALPAALAAIRDRLTHPGLLLDLNQYTSLPAFRAVAGTPSETGPGWERYGAIVLATSDNQPSPALRPDLLDADGTDPYLPVLRRDAATPYPMEVALRLARDPRFAALLDDPGEPGGGARAADGTWWPQDPTRSVPDLVAEVAAEHGLGADAAAVYLMLLAMPDPTDRNLATWTGWRPTRLKAARAELAGTDLVVEASRSRAGRSLFLPGPWLERGRGHAPIEGWKTVLFDLAPDGTTVLGVTVPLEPVADLYRRARQRLRDGDRPRLDELPTRAARR